MDNSKIAFGVMVNDIVRLDMVLRQSELDPAIQCHTVKNPESATKGLNILLDIMDKAGTEIAVLTHQDMYYQQGWMDKLKEQVSLLPESWVVAGIVGKDNKGVICGHFKDCRIPHHFNTSHVHKFPQEACCFDECCIIVNMKHNFRFDESLDGFDLYGTLCVLQAWEIGGTAWVIDAYAEHYCLRPFTWVPCEKFQDNYKTLYERFINIGRVDSTVISRIDSTAVGLPKEELGFFTSA